MTDLASWSDAKRLLALTIAIVNGNPLFHRIPMMLADLDPDTSEKMLEYLKLEALHVFKREEIVKWLLGNIDSINSQTY